MTSLDAVTHPELEETLKLIAERPRCLTLKQIATGANVQLHWLTYFARGKIPEPGFNRVMRVRDFLRTHPELKKD